MPRHFQYNGPARRGPKRDMKAFADALVEARLGARLKLEELVRHSGVARRTLLRWECALVRPRPKPLARVVRALHHYAPESAAKVAQAAGITLRDAGVETKPVAPPITTQSKPAAPVLGAAHVLDAIVCATADASDTKPEQARRGLRAAVARMQEMGVTLEGLATMFEARGP